MRGLRGGYDRATRELREGYERITEKLREYYHSLRTLRLEKPIYPLQKEGYEKARESNKRNSEEGMRGLRGGYEIAARKLRNGYRRLRECYEGATR